MRMIGFFLMLGVALYILGMLFGEDTAQGIIITGIVLLAAYNWLVAN